MKNNLPGTHFMHISSTYISLIDGSGCTCDNCGRLIANIVTVRNDLGKQFTIGADCAKNILPKETIEGINRNIKQVKKAKEDAPKIEARRKWDIAYKDLRALEDAAGINNTNLNEQWARDKYNTLLTEIESKHGIERFSYRR